MRFARVVSALALASCVLASTGCAARPAAFDSGLRAIERPTRLVADAGTPSVRPVSASTPATATLALTAHAAKRTTPIVRPPVYRSRRVGPSSAGISEAERIRRAKAAKEAAMAQAKKQAEEFRKERERLNAGS